MLVVLDTNVILSSLLSPKGPPAEIIKQWEIGAFDVAISPLLLSELERALGYPKVKKYLKGSEENTVSLLKRFVTIAVLVEPQLVLDVIHRDQPDNRVLQCAKAAGAGYLVTGDDDLLELSEYEGVVILSPAEFITLLELKKE